MSQTIAFLEPRLVGERFQGHAIPLEILKDLSVLEEMVVEVAKWQFLKDHPERKRIPRGFTDGISIKLTDISDGSAIPKLVLFVASLSLLPPENQNYFEKARDSIVSSIDAAEHDETSITKYLPLSLLVYFDRIGRGLRDNESIEFSPNNPARPARLNKTTRHKLLEVSMVNEWSEDVIERGSIPGIDQDRKKFTLQLFDGSKVQIPLEPQHTDMVFDALKGYHSGTKVVVHGVGRYNRVSKLVSFDSIEHISLLDALDVAARLEELSTLKDGWLDGKGLKPNADGLNWLAGAFDCFFNQALPLPHLFPTPEGGVQAEWSIGVWEASLEIDLIAKKGEYQAVNVKSNDTDETDLNFNAKGGWAELNKRLEAIVRESA